MFILLLKILAYIVGGIFLFLVVGLVLTHISHVRNSKRKHVGCKCATPYIQARAEQAMFQKLSEEYKVGTDQIVELWRELYASDLEDFFLAFDLRDQESITRFILDSFLEKQDGLATIPSVEKILNSGRGVLESELRKYYSEETFNNFYRNNKKD